MVIKELIEYLLLKISLWAFNFIPIWGMGVQKNITPASSVTSYHWTTLLSKLLVRFSWGTKNPMSNWRYSHPFQGVKYYLLLVQCQPCYTWPSVFPVNLDYTSINVLKPSLVALTSTCSSPSKNQSLHPSERSVKLRGFIKRFVTC